MTFLLSAQVIDAIAQERKLEQPSISYGAENLYMHGPLEELTRGNLTKVSCSCLLIVLLQLDMCIIDLARHKLQLICILQAIGSLVEGDGSIVQVNDKKLASTLRIKLRFSDTVMHDANGTG